MVLNKIHLKTEGDMNMKFFASEYIFYWGTTRFLKQLLAFWIEQGRREVTICHMLWFIALQLVSLGVCSYLFVQAMSMNESLPDNKVTPGIPGGKVFLISFAPFFICATLNFIEFAIRWFILFWFVFVILDDYTESVDKDRTSMLEAMMPGSKTHAFDAIMKERLTQWDRIKKFFYYQLKLQRGSNCDICMELFVAGEGTISLECND